MARVALDVSLAHLDRPFDYLVSAELDAAAVVGCRIRVRFAGRTVDGYLLDRVDASEHEGTLAYLDKVISSEPVLTAEVARLARVVADRYAGTLSDVLRLAVPPRHARAEGAVTAGIAPEGTEQRTRLRVQVSTGRGSRTRAAFPSSSPSLPRAPGQ